MNEEALAFGCGGETLLGIVARPAGVPTGDVGALIVVGGPQYRAGSHRQFVLWARAFAAAGVPALRFDVRGMGDSGGALRAFTSLDDDIGTAVQALVDACPCVRRVVLCGLCDGASAALMYLDARADPRVAGLVLLNPWVRTEQSQARTVVRHYYWSRLTSARFWRKLLGGGVARGAVGELLASVRRAACDGGPAVTAASGYIERMADAWRAFGGPILLVLSGNDYTAKEFLDHAARDARWAALLARPEVQRVNLAQADHTFSTAADRLLLEQAVIAWLARLGWIDARHIPEPAL